MTGELAGTRPASPNPLERPLKIGWLKKQRSIVKNWQQRYFVLKGQQLYYYKDEDDVKPQVGRSCWALPILVSAFLQLCWSGIGLGWVWRRVLKELSASGQSHSWDILVRSFIQALQFFRCLQSLLGLGPSVPKQQGAGKTPLRKLLLSYRVTETGWAEKELGTAPVL